MKRNFVVMMLMLVMLVGLTGKAEAAEPRIVSVTPELTFDGTTANCEVRITSIGKQIKATLELWNGNTVVDSWTATATSRLVISESCTVVKGQSYTLKVSGTIAGEVFGGTPVSAKCN